MSRLIDADALNAFISDLEYDIKMDQDSLDYEDLSDVNRKLIKNDKDCKQNVVDILKSTPTVDAVPVVRCKDCKRCDIDTTHHKYFCMRYGLDIPGNWYCADGDKENV